jgi:hypothetical protein
VDEVFIKSQDVRLPDGIPFGTVDSQNYEKMELQIFIILTVNGYKKMEIHLFIILTVNGTERDPVR